MKGKAIALLETVFVFLLVLVAFQATQLIPIMGQNAPMPLRTVISYILVAVIPLAVLVVSGRRFSDYGIAISNLRYNLKTVVISLPSILIIKVCAYLVGWHQWYQALLLAAIAFGAFFLLAWMLKGRPVPLGPQSGLLLIPFMPCIVAGLTSSAASASGVLLRVIYMFLLVGPAEEILFRGYIQSRLNGAFGQPRQFFGVRAGWGLLIASLAFGFWHVLNPTLFNPILGHYHLSWQHGLWTFPLGLLLAFVRERTGSVFAPAILHGVINV